MLKDLQDLKGLKDPQVLKVLQVHHLRDVMIMNYVLEVTQMVLVPVEMEQ